MNIELPPNTHTLKSGNCTKCSTHTDMLINNITEQLCFDCDTIERDKLIYDNLNKSRKDDSTSIMDAKYKDAEWSIFKDCDPAQHTCVTKIYGWFTNFEIGKWLVMKGNQGTGKTLIKNLLIKGLGINHPNLKIHSTTGLHIFNKYMKYWNEFHCTDELITYYSSFDILMIDEIGKHSQAPEFKNFLNQVIDNYYNDNKSLVGISNFELKRITEGGTKFLSDFLDIDRINEKALVVDFKFESYRGRQ